MKNYLIGVDLGTTGTKAAIFDTQGDLLAASFQESILYYPKPGWVQQDMEDFYTSSIQTIKGCLEKSNIDSRGVAAISFDGQMAGIGSVDKNWGTPTYYDSWLDNRCMSYIDRMIEYQDLIIARSGGPPTYSHGPKILWWKEEQPEVFQKIVKFVVPAGYVAGRMAGLKGEEAFIDYTYIHFSCLSDTRNLIWDSGLCDLFGIPMRKLPRIVKPWEVIGELTPGAARDCGLPSGIPIVAGCGDQAAGMLGAAMVETGMAFDVAGTASVFAICVDKFIPDLDHKALFTARLVPEDLWYSLAYINGGGMNLRWFRDRLLQEDQRTEKNVYALLDKEAATIPPGSERLIFLPHLGGRVTPSDPDIRGLWLGFTWSHGKGHFYRSLLEAVAYEYAYYLGIERGLFPDMEFKEARVIGGGSVSYLWNQIKADVLGIPYVQLNRQEYAVWGSAILAGYAVGIFDDLKTTSKKFVKPLRRVEPRPDNHAFYKPIVEIYISLFNTMRKTYQELSTLPSPSQKNA